MAQHSPTEDIKWTKAIGGGRYTWGVYRLELLTGRGGWRSWNVYKGEEVLANVPTLAQAKKRAAQDGPPPTKGRIMTHNVPTVMSRIPSNDIKLLALRVIKDRLNWSEALTEHVADTPDLLVTYVERALGLGIRINWMEVTDAELPAIKEWQDYCQKLFDEVPDHVIRMLTDDL